MEYKELYTIANKIVSQCYNKWRVDYKLDSVDYNDLKQEAHLYMWKAIEKYKDKKDYFNLKRLAMSAVYLRLKALLFRSITHQRMFTKLEMLYNSKDYVDGEFTEDDYFSYLLKDGLPEPSLVWLQLQEVCDPEEYKLLDMVVLRGMSYEEAGQNLFQDKQISRQRIEQRYNRLRTRLKKYLTKRYFPDIIRQMDK